MKVEQLFTGCLAEMSYYISDNGEAAIIDPLREIDPYIKMANEDGAKIKWIFLTHFHADFVSGQVDLAEKTGATIVFGPHAKTAYEIHVGQDGELFSIGNINIKLMHTPGHTIESSCFLLVDQDGNTPYVFSGDCLFIGDVGRPDLAVQSDLSQEDLAGFLFESLRNKIIPLPDDTIVYPNHGAGSECGKNISTETFDTLGNQKKTNYALRANITKEEFIKEVTAGLKQPPAYFPMNAGLNKGGTHKSYYEVMAAGTTKIDVDTFKEYSEQNDVLVLDTRTIEEYTNYGTIPGAWWIGIDGSFAPWVGALIVDPNQNIVFIASDDKKAKEVVTRLSRIGFDHALGYLDGGFAAWKAKGLDVAKVNSISVDEFAGQLNNGKVENPFDVRKETEYQSEHVIGIDNFPLDFINTNFAEIKLDKAYTLHCASGYRSLIASSILKAKGVVDVTNVKGGFSGIKSSGKFKLTDYVCPSTFS